MLLVVVGCFWLLLVVTVIGCWFSAFVVECLLVVVGCCWLLLVVVFVVVAVCFCCSRKDASGLARFRLSVTVTLL